MAKIFAPYKNYCGISASVTFKDGVGETSDPHLIEWFMAHSYSVEEDPVNAEPPKAEGSTPMAADKESGTRAAPKRSGKKAQGASGKKKEE